MSKSDLEEALAFHLRAHRLPTPYREFKFAQDRRYRADFAWPTHNLLVEVDGGSWVQGRHTRGKGFEDDCRKSCVAAICGYRVMHITGEMIETGEAVRFIADALKEEAVGDGSKA